MGFIVLPRHKLDGKFRRDMTKKYERALFVFRRDLRLIDNTGLNTACRDATEVVPVFIFDPRQISSHKYLSRPALRFMLESLEELHEALKTKGSKLNLLFGKPEAKLAEVLARDEIDAIVVNRDYTPFSKKRDSAIEALCQKHGVSFISEGDSLLQEPEDVSKGDGTPYSIFTPFYRRAKKLEVRSISRGTHSNFSRHGLKSETITFKQIKSKLSDLLPSETTKDAYKGGRKEALKQVRRIASLKNYGQERDFPYLKSTSMLSAHNKFGTCSIREVYHAAQEAHGKESEIVRQLYWRDFYSHVALHFPHVFSGAFREKFNSLEWNYNKSSFQRWCDGQTGFPIVDAGMRELNQSGYMHNRVRLITASFLVKDLGINWQEGEKYFAQKLFDYDPAVNNGNWQWVASTGCDAQPFFRVFNPWLQQKKFDPECEYIKKWVPELKGIPSNTLHKLDKARPEDLDYPKPIVDHSEAKEDTLDRYYEVK